MLHFSKEELQELLTEKGIDAEDIQKLYDEGVDGAAFLDLNDDDLKSVAIKLGSRKKILRIIQTEKDNLHADRTVDNSNTSSNDVEHCLQMQTSWSSPSTGSCLQTQPSTSTVNHVDSSLTPFSSPEMISVPDFLTANARGRRLLQVLQNVDPDTTIMRSDISELVRICVNAMIDQCTLYPSTIQKVNLAKAIIAAVPVLKSTRDEVEGYEHFYDPLSRSGLIEWRLKTLRAKASPSKKKNKRKRDKFHTNSDEENVDEEVFAEKIKWLKYESASDLHKKEIFSVMDETFHVRRFYIKKENPSVGQVLIKYPKLKNFKGDLIDAEFIKMYPDAGNFLGLFPSYYVPRIHKYVSKSRPDLKRRFPEELDENLSALLMLAELFPVTGLRKKKVSEDQRAKSPSDVLFRYIGVNGCLEEEISNIKETQPYILCVGEKFSQSNNFLILDKNPVELGICPLRAFDILYKSFYVFNVKYPEALSTFFNFMDAAVYKLSSTAKSSVENVNTLLCRIIL